ncbi:MAG: hypothetical protein AAGC77_14525 [Pseudomonadota bacterium]
MGGVIKTLFTLVLGVAAATAYDSAGPGLPSLDDITKGQFFASGAGDDAVAAAEISAADDTDDEDDECNCPQRTGAHSKNGFMGTYDVDGDGVVTRAEFDGERAESYDLKDADGDGVVVVEEYVAEYEGRLDQQLADRRKAAIDQTYVRFGVLDSDDSEEMSEEEFNASGERMFTGFDTNEDGVVDEADPEPVFEREADNVDTDDDAEDDAGEN